jgi:rod shape-determining protein MreD
VTSEVSPVRKALTAVVFAVALFAAVVIQLTMLNRLPLPGPAAPDLVLLLVAAIAVCVSPAAAAVTGFAGGLALDVAPPAAHYAGEYALVFCLVAYAAARVAVVIWDLTGERDPITTFTVMATAVAAGEAGKAALGLLLSDPDVTSAAVTRVLPAAVLYNLLLSPIVYWLVTRVARGAAAWGTTPERAPAPDFGHAGQLGGVFRQASTGAAPNLRLAGTGASYANPSPARRVPKLRLSGARAGSSLGTVAAASPGATPSLAGGRAPRLNFAADRPRPARRPAKRTPGKNWLRASVSPSLRAAARTPRSPSAGWLSAASSSVRAARRTPRSPSPGWLSAAGAAGRAGGLAGALAGGRAHGRAGSLAGGRRRGLPGAAFTGTGFTGSARSAVSPAAAHPARSADEVLAARSAPSGLSALSGAGAPLAGRRSPQAGWLRAARHPSGSSRQRHAPRRGWLGGASRPHTVIGSAVGGRTVIGSGLGSRGAASRRSRGTGGNWYAASPSGAWLRRSHHPWRKRRQRLLRLVGVGR